MCVVCACVCIVTHKGEVECVQYYIADYIYYRAVLCPVLSGGEDEDEEGEGGLLKGGNEEC